MKKIDFRKLAEKIIDKIRNESSPEICTWGNEFPYAHYSLFLDYYDDLIESIAEVLKENVS